MELICRGMSRLGEDGRDGGKRIGAFGLERQDATEAKAEADSTRLSQLFSQIRAA